MFRIQSIESSSGKVIQKTGNVAGKLCVKLTTGEELFGKMLQQSLYVLFYAKLQIRNCCNFFITTFISVL